MLNDEENPELIQLMKKIAQGLDDIVQRYKTIAKKKGIRYEIAAKKKDAIEKQIAGETAS